MATVNVVGTTSTETAGGTGVWKWRGFDIGLAEDTDFAGAVNTTKHAVLVPRKATWALEASLTLEVDTHPVLDEAMVMVPYNIAHYVVNDFRMNNGWPVEPPAHDIRATASTSVEGEVLSYRMHPLQLITGAGVRWVASTETWDSTSMIWRPHLGEPGWTWQTSPDFAPTLITDYTYRIESEMITRSAMNFNDENKEHMWTSLGGYLQVAYGFSVIIVLTMASRFSTSLSDPTYSGILCPGHPTPSNESHFVEEVGGGSFSVHLRGSDLYAEADENGFHRLYGAAPVMASANPSYLGVTVSPPYMVTYLGLGPSQLQSKAIHTDNRANELDWVLGRATGTLSHCADMSVFDIGFYPEALSAADMTVEIAKLAASYGGS